MILRLICCLLVTTVASSVHATADFIVKPFAAVVTMDGYDNGIAAGLGISWPLRQLAPYLTAEAEFMKSFAKMDGNDTDRAFSKVGAYGALTYPFDPRVNIKGKLGFRYAAFKDSGSDSSSDTGVDWGAGLQLLLDSRKTVEFEYITSDENNFSQWLAGLRIQF